MAKGRAKVHTDTDQALEEADFVEAGNNSESEEEKLFSDDNRHANDAKHDDIRSEEEEEEESDDEDDDGLEEEEELDTDDDSDLSDDDEDDDDEDQDGKPSSQSDRKDKKGFLAGGKAASFAKAFAKVIGKPAAGTTAPSTSKVAVPILAKSKSLADRQAKDAELVLKDREAKRARLEMKQRGRMQPKPKGEDPDADATEKDLLKTATRGVVKLFNAVAKAQKQMRESQDMTGNRLKAAKASRSSFIDELKNRQSGGGKVKDGGRGRNRNEDDDNDNDNDKNGGKQPGWDVLKDGFAGLGGGSKMKDWDRKVEVDDGGVGDDVDMDSDGK